MLTDCMAYFTDSYNYAIRNSRIYNRLLLCQPSQNNPQRSSVVVSSHFLAHCPCSVFHVLQSRLYLESDQELHRQDQAFQTPHSTPRFSFTKEYLKPWCMNISSPTISTTNYRTEVLIQDTYLNPGMEKMRNSCFQLVNAYLVGMGGMEQWFQMLQCPHNKEFTCARNRKLAFKLYFRTAEQITKQDENISMALLNSLLNTTGPSNQIRQ